MNGAHFSGENTTVSRQSKTKTVRVIQKYPNSDQTVGIDDGWSLKLPENITKEFWSNYRKQRRPSSPAAYRCVPLGTIVKSTKWRSNSVRKISVYII
jgi:hypothetical protein